MVIDNVHPCANCGDPLEFPWFKGLAVREQPVEYQAMCECGAFNRIHHETGKVYVAYMDE